MKKETKQPKRLDPKDPRFAKVAAAEERLAEQVKVAKSMQKERAAIHSSSRARGRITR